MTTVTVDLVMPQKHRLDTSLDCDRRPLEAPRSAAVPHDAKSETLPLESARSKSEFRELQDRWSLLERLYALPF
jgi:hypothetical protein